MVALMRDKCVVVTGAGRGIGRTVALDLARAGATVLACYRTPGPHVESLAAELVADSPGSRTVPADVSDPDTLDRLADTCREVGGRVDGVVNNAGVDGRSPLAELTPAQWQRVVAVNLTGPYLVTRALLALLPAGASVVNIGASAALRGRPNAAHYGAAKAGLAGLTRSLAKELGPQGIRVNLVAPGVVPGEGEQLPPPVQAQVTRMTALGRLGSARDVSGVVRYLLSDRASYVTGATVHVDGGM